MSCRTRSDVRVLRCLDLSRWDDAKIIGLSINFLTDLIPRVSAPDVFALLCEWLDILISKSTQSLGTIEESLGLPLQTHDAFRE